MSSLTDFFGGGATTSIVNYFSSGGVSSAWNLQAAESTNSREVLSGALTAGTLATVLSVTGAGEVPWLGAYTKDGTSRTVRARVTVDGVVVFDATSAAITVSGQGLMVCGVEPTASRYTQSPVPVRFFNSLLVEVASSLTETGKVAISYALSKR